MVVSAAQNARNSRARPPCRPVRSYALGRVDQARRKNGSPSKRGMQHQTMRACASISALIVQLPIIARFKLAGGRRAISGFGVIGILAGGGPKRQKAPRIDALSLHHSGLPNILANVAVPISRQTLGAKSLNRLAATSNAGARLLGSSVATTPASMVCRRRSLASRGSVLPRMVT
jgi:hypothetical protein